jgi:tetratricopeptide (TPR) repeat protein
MKIHDLEPVSQKAVDSQSNRKRTVAVVVALVAVCAAAVYYFGLDKNEKPDQDVQDSNSVSAELEKLGVAEEDRVEPFKPTPEIKAFAEKEAAGRSDVEAIQALFAAIQKLKKEGRWKPHLQREPRLLKPLPASRLLSRLNSAEEAPFEALSYELAGLLLAAARSVDADASMVEIYRFLPEKKPADSNGKLGRYGVVSGDGGKGSRLFEPYSGRMVDTDKAEIFRLSDAQAAAPYYGIGALALLAGRDTAEALTLNKIAVGLAPDNPYFRSCRGMICIASGAPAEALIEFEKAVKKRGDAVTRTNLAEILLMADSTGTRSEAEIQLALNAMPDYGRAHAILAIVHLINKEVDKAEQELALAERLEPTSPVIAMYWSQFYLSQAKYEDAISKALDAVRFSDESVASLIGLAQIYQASARFSDMRATLDRVYKLVDSPAIARELKMVFQYDPEDSAEEGDVEMGLGPDSADRTQPSGGSGLRLGNGLGGGLGDEQGGGLGSGKRLNIDLNLK